MTFGPELLLIGAVTAVGVLHTLVPDHWAPIALQNLSFGPVERYGEVLSGTVIAALGVVFLIWPFA